MRRSGFGMPAVLISILAVLVAAGLLFFGRHHRSDPVSPERASADFAALRQSLDLRANTTSPRIHMVHTVVFDTRGGNRLVRIDMPLPLVRLWSQHGQFRYLGQLTFLDDTEFDPDPIALSVADVRKHGPGLLVDRRHGSGGQFISWVD